MKKILYLHGFASSGASGTVEMLRREFWERVDAARRAVVVALDIPLDPLVAERELEELAYGEMPDLVIGTSMGGMYAQMLHGFTRICVNPSFWTSFGGEDTLVGPESREAFERHYPGMSRTFAGGHRMNAEVVARTLIPFIRTLGVV